MSEFNSDAINKVIINAVSGRKYAPKGEIAFSNPVQKYNKNAKAPKKCLRKSSKTLDFQKSRERSYPA